MKNTSRQVKNNTMNLSKKTTENKKLEENFSFKAYNTRNLDSKEKVKNKNTFKNMDLLLFENKKSKNKFKKRENVGSEGSEKIKEHKTPESKSSHKKEKKRCVPLKKKIKKINNLNNNEETSSNYDMEKENISADDGKLSVLEIDQACKNKNSKKKDPPKSVECHNSSSLENTNSSPNSYKQKKPTKMDLENRINKIISDLKNTSTSERKEDESLSKEKFKLNPEDFMEDRYLCISPSKRESISKKENNPIGDFNISPSFPVGITNYINIKNLVTIDVVSNVDYILCMIELAKNNEYYNLNKVTKSSKYFWENILKIKDLQKILGNNLAFIMKCWIGLREVLDCEEIISDVISTKNLIDWSCPNVKILIEAMEYFKCFNSDIQSRFSNFYQTQIYIFLNYKKKLKEIIEEDDFNIEDCPLFKDETSVHNTQKNFKSFEVFSNSHKNKEIIIRNSPKIYKETSELSNKFPEFSAEFINVCMKSCSNDKEMTEAFLNDPDKYYNSKIN